MLAHGLGEPLGIASFDEANELRVGLMRATRHVGFFINGGDQERLRHQLAQKLDYHTIARDLGQERMKIVRRLQLQRPIRLRFALLLALHVHFQSLQRLGIGSLHDIRRQRHFDQAPSREYFLGLAHAGVGNDGATIAM